MPAGHQIEISYRAAANAEVLAEHFRIEPEQVVEDLIALATVQPEILAAWLDGQRWTMAPAS